MATASGVAPVNKLASGELIVRQNVPEVAHYGEYKRYLRYDFYYSCAYCTIAETEAQTIRFTIDHYEPVSSSPGLEREYSNLMYACDACNTLKGDLWPPAEAQAAGSRYFRPDADIFTQHFSSKVTLKGVELEGKTAVGEFSIEQIDLNRQVLLRLRQMRADLSECDRFIAHGVRQLKEFPVDQLPPQIKAKAQRLISEGLDLASMCADKIDDLLREFARSHLADPDSEADERAAERRSSRKELQSLFPGIWRAPRKPKKG